MSRTSAAWIAAAFVLLAAPGPIAAHTSTPGPDAVGIGSYPLTPVCASAWLVAHGDSIQKQLVLMVYIVGRPGWVEAASNFEGHLDRSPVEFSVTCGDVPIRLTYEPKRRRATIQGRAQELEHDNVFVITTGDRRSSAVRSLGLHDLTFEAADNPAIELVARDPAVREGLVGRRPAAPNPARASATPPAMASEIQGLLDEARRWRLGSDPAGPARACSLYARAAELGAPEAEYAFGYCLESGKGAAQDPERANDFYRRAAEHGHLSAAFKLGWSSRTGRGTTKDPAAALGWFRQCAVAGDSICQALVGQMFELGEGTSARLDSARTWYGRAAARGVPDAQYALARMAGEEDSADFDAEAGLLWITVLEARRSQLPPDLSRDLARLRQRLEPRLGPEARTRLAAQAEAWLIEDSKHALESLAR
jgi:TPR repeat protein